MVARDLRELDEKDNLNDWFKEATKSISDSSSSSNTPDILDLGSYDGEMGRGRWAGAG